jgi:hypothetical protein
MVDRKRTVLRELVTMWAEAKQDAALRQDIECAIAFCAAIRSRELTFSSAMELAGDLERLAGPDWKVLEARLQLNLAALEDAHDVVDAGFGRTPAGKKPRPTA